MIIRATDLKQKKEELSFLETEALNAELKATEQIIVCKLCKSTAPNWSGINQEENAKLYALDVKKLALKQLIAETSAA